MKYFIDTEFIENGERRTIDLISIGIVAEDGRELYLEADFPEDRLTPWLIENVVPHLGPRDSRIPLEEIARLVDEFVDDRPEFWGYYADYDWVVFCWLFGSMIDLPKRFPKYCMDLKQKLEGCRPRITLPVCRGQEHRAIDDARWNRRLYEKIERRFEDGCGFEEGACEIYRAAVEEIAGRWPETTRHEESHPDDCEVVICVARRAIADAERVLQSTGDNKLQRLLCGVMDQARKNQYLNALSCVNELTGVLLQRFSAVLKGRG